MTCTAVIELASGALTGIGVFIAGLAAWRGSNSWRKQLVGQDGYNLANRLTTHLLLHQKQIREFRNVGYPPEVSSDAWEELLKIGAEIDAEVIEAQVYWGQDYLKEEKQDLLNCFNELSLQKAQYDSTRDLDTETRKRASMVRYRPVEMDTTDEFGEKVTKAVLAFVEKLRPHLKI